MAVHWRLASVGIAWGLYFPAVTALALLRSPWAALLALTAFPLLIVTGYLAPWRASLGLLGGAVALVTILGRDSINLHLTFGNGPLSAGMSLLIVGSILIGSGLAGQLAIKSARRAGADAEARDRAEKENARLRLVLRGSSHEIRNCLQGIEFVAFHVRSDLHDPSAATQLEHSSRRVLRLTNDLADSARCFEGELRIRSASFDVASAVRGLVNEYEPVARAKGLDVRYDGRTCPLVADQARVEQVVANFLQNAIRYTPAGGRIGLDVKERPEAVEVTVADTGLGMTPAQIASLFRPFTRYHEDTCDGSGLGLWLSQNIVQAHGGRIEVESAGPGKGASFKAIFPRASGRATPELAAPQVLEGARGLAPVPA